MRIKNPLYAYEECPRFDFCEINNCPLHPNYNKNLFNDLSDPSQVKKQKCVSKSIRKRIGLKWGLKNKGMRPKEITSQRNWDNLPEYVKQERIAKLKKVSPVSRLLAVGCRITPPRTNQLPNPQPKEETSSPGASMLGVGGVQK